jgi:hypothetical protein
MDQAMRDGAQSVTGTRPKEGPHRFEPLQGRRQTSHDEIEAVRPDSG